MFKKAFGQSVDIARPYDRFDIEFVFTDIISSLRADFKFANTYEQACEQVNKMEGEIRDSLLKSNPNLVHQYQLSANPSDSLTTISEDVAAEQSDEDAADDGGNDHDQDDYDDDDDDDDEHEYRSGQRNDNADDDGEDYAGENDEPNRHDSLTGSASDADDAGTIRIVQTKKETVCKEDDEFMKAFESMVTETIAQRTKETIKMPTVDISVPMCARKPKTAQVQDVNELSGLSMLKEKQPSATEPDAGTEARKEAFNFVLMLKKGNKTQYQNMQVPVTSEFATQFKAKEQLEKAEKEKLKQLTLNINDRIEQEEFQEMVQQQSTQKQSMLGNTNRDRFKYNHPKGAPDADQIFGTSSQRTYRGYTK